MDNRIERVVLIIADISGYTRFMLANRTALVHGQMVVTKLLEEIIRALAEELEAEFGPAPLRVPLRELVFTGTTPE